MTEIVAAHLERVARLNEILDEIAAGRGPFKVDNWDFACSVIENSKALAKEAKELLAAALAACAREAKLEVLHRLPAHAWPDKTTYPQKWGVELRNALQDELLKAMDEVALERAVGEKAGDGNV